MTRELTNDGLELASIGWIGLAEVDRAEGDTAGAAHHYEHAMECFATNDQRNSPWYLMAMSGLVSATTFDGSLSPERVAWWARRLRTRATGGAPHSLPISSTSPSWERCWPVGRHGR